MGKLIRALGLMSGTSMDGIDVALLATDAEARVERGPAMTFPYGEDMRALIREAITDARETPDRGVRVGAMPHAERELTERHAAAVSAFLRKQGIARETIDVIGFHGHTVLHQPARGITIQLGLGEMLAELTRLSVVYDLRADDVAAKGQGAPLVPVYHRALVAQLPQRPVAVLNIGGVANVTWIGRNGDLLAFDTGPGNALIDDLVRRRTGAAFDADGTLCEAGRVQHDIVHAYLTHGFFGARPPKSLDRDAFDAALVSGLRDEDAAATLAAFTVEAIARAREHMPEQPELWIVAGGGRRNRAIMKMLAARVENAVVPAEAVGLDGDSLEAEAWGYLAARSLQGLPVTFPGTTGVAQPMTGGRLAVPAKNWGRP